MSLAKITADVLRPANKKSISGLEQTKAIIINVDDLPNSGITPDGTYPEELLTDIALNSTTSGYQLEFNCAKENLKSTIEEVINENSDDGFRHILNELVWPDITPAGLNQLNRMRKGRYYIVVEAKWKGESDVNAFWFYGRYLGLIMRVVTWNSQENSGLPLVTFETPENTWEPYAPCQLLETDYATTKAAFNNKFASA